MKSLINHRYIKMILFITLLVSILILLKFGLSLYSNVYNPSSKYVNTIEGFTNVTDNKGNRLNTTDKYLIYSVPHKRVLQARSDKSVKSASINLSKPNIKINADMLFKIIDNPDGSQGIWNIGRKGVLGIDDAKSKTYITPMEYAPSFPTKEMMQERFNIIKYGKNNTVAIKSAFYKERYYYLHSNGSTRVGKGLGNWERMQFINYSVIENKQLDIMADDERNRIARNLQIANDKKLEVYDKQSKINALRVNLDNNTDRNQPKTQSKIKTLQAQIDKLIST